MARRFVALLSLAAGAALAAFALDRRLAARRGSSAREPLRMLVVIDAPIWQTWRVIADIPLQVEWMREMTDIRLTTPGPAGVGTRGVATVRILGIPVADPVEIVEFEPPTRYAIRHEGLFTGGGLITLEAGADGTTTIVRWEETLIPPVLPELLGLAQRPVLRAIFQADLHRLRALVESGGID